MSTTLGYSAASMRELAAKRKERLADKALKDVLNKIKSAAEDGKTYTLIGKSRITADIRAHIKELGYNVAPSQQRESVLRGGPDMVEISWAE